MIMIPIIFFTFAFIYVFIMIVDCIPFDQIRFFSSFISDYVSEKETLRTLYHRFPSVENFEKQILEKQQQFSDEARVLLVNSLREQYASLKTSDKVQKNIAKLGDRNTFTITTGHQLSLFTGPLYFIYKIISVINTCEILSKKYPDYHFVPIYWMATEDHDFEEINHFHFKQQTFRWNSSQTGMTGNFDTTTLDAVFSSFISNLGVGKNAEFLKQLFENSYLKNKDLASATRSLVNTLFENYGLVIIDGNDSKLKKSFASFMRNDILKNTAYQEVKKTIIQIQELDKIYPTQVNPREINLFYLTEKGRNRIVITENGYGVHETEMYFTEKELLNELENHPERFSPNVIMRPLYQEVILPNLAYIGGGGEIAYWLELKSFFDSEKIVFPILMLRNSAVFITDKQHNRIKKAEMKIADLFLKSENLKNIYVQKLSEFPIDFSEQRKALQNQFANLYVLAEKTDKTFLNAVKSQEIKQLKGLNNLEKRLLKAQKRQLSEKLERLTTLQSELFPNGSLQERFTNFSELYLEYGESFFEVLKNDFNPFHFEFLAVK